MSSENLRRPTEEDLILSLQAIEAINDLEIDFPGKPSKEYIKKIAFPKKGSLGANVALAMMRETEQLIQQFVDRTEDNHPGSLFQNLSLSVLVSTTYFSVADCFLTAEEVIRSGEPPEDEPAHDEIGKLIDSCFEIVSESLRQDAEVEEGREIGQDEWESRETAESAQIYLRKKQLGETLRKSSSPLEFVDIVAERFFLSTNPKMSEEEKFQHAVKYTLIDIGRDRFHTLYNAAWRLRGKELGMTPQQLHKEFLDSILKREE